MTRMNRRKQKEMNRKQNPEAAADAAKRLEELKKSREKKVSYKTSLTNNASKPASNNRYSLKFEGKPKPSCKSKEIFRMEIFYCDWCAQECEGTNIICYTKNPTIGLFEDSFGRVHRFTKRKQGETFDPKPFLSPLEMAMPKLNCLRSP